MSSSASSLLEKRAVLDARRAKWMQDRSLSLMRQEAEGDVRRELRMGGRGGDEERRSSSTAESRLEHNRSYSSSSIATTGGGGGSSAPTNSNSNRASNDDAFLNKLTERLATHIREEVKKEMMVCVNNPRAKDLVVERMDCYLQEELQTHVCKICFEVMLSPDHTPILLFPCGHTFCKLCMDTNASVAGKSGGGGKCPFCRNKIESSAVNLSLKELIDRFAKQRSSVQNASMLDDIFGGGGGSAGLTTSATTTATSGSQQSGGAGGDERALNRYLTSLASADMRCTILKNELHDIISGGEMESYRKRKASLTEASAHLREERARLERAAKQIEEEMCLVDAHLAEQGSKLEEVVLAEARLEDRARLLRATIQNLEVEMERTRLLSRGLKQQLELKR